MKRDNILLPAYIMFLIIALCVRVFIDYPMWKTIVIAATCSSWLLAMADSDYVDAKNILTAVHKELEFCDSTLQEARRFLKILEHMEDVPPVDLTHFSEDDITSREDQIVLLEKCEENFINRKAIAEKAIITAKQKVKISTIFTGLGFVVFFCILTFETVAQIAIIYQDIFTVSAFIIILATQRKSSKDEKKLEEQQTILNEHRAAWEIIRKQYQKLDMEETTNAD